MHPYGTLICNIQTFKYSLIFTKENGLHKGFYQTIKHYFKPKKSNFLSAEKIAFLVLQSMKGL